MLTIGPFGPPVLQARMRETPEDFFVEELPLFEASGAGEHLLLTIEERGMNTAFAAGLIARWAGVPESAVSYAGMKDRHALTRQRFSVHLPGRAAPDVAGLETGDLRVLDAARHARKLQRGALRGNRFVLRLREIVGDRAVIDARLQAIGERGVPNAFGEQRFGHGGANIEAARAMFAGRRVRREQRSILLSAARSELFNRALAARVADGSWETGLPGEVWMLGGSHSVFGPEPDSATLAERVHRLDIHPTGPLWGRGELRTRDACRALEEAVLADAADLRDGLERAGLSQERRTLRVAVAGLAWTWLADDVLELRFELPPGAYATSLLATLGVVMDAAARSGGSINPTGGVERHLHGDPVGVD
ncbi:MAG: tRNA pseudouridine(13) synthase TruD [Proteobacteria bacterium]|nr:tRNA pseudouridine(13) synthase TruD [Pseudomonadota bacterium]MBS0462640.1 tRNA pseudouridine(13) synthase TruD [Pseudomonadota bacterium]